MSRTSIERVRVHIGAMGGAEFERFMCDLLPRVYPDFKNLEPSFNLLGKTVRGKCDAHVYHAAEDAYTAIICTTQQVDIRTKVLADIQNLTTSRFAAKIRRVLVCVNTSLQDEVEDYRNACAAHRWEFDPLSLSRATLAVMSESDLLLNYFGEDSAPKSPEKSRSRHFDCGKRIAEARLDVGLHASQLIEHIDFPSQRQWAAIEAGHDEVSELHIDAMSSLTGISAGWLKHELGRKYLVETISDHQSEKILNIADARPLRAIMAIEPGDMEVFLVVQYTELRWRVFEFGFNLNFEQWFGDHHYIPRIFELFKVINRSLGHPDGRVISKSMAAELSKGHLHPTVVLKKLDRMSYWFDDLFDLEGHYPIADKYQHHGAWFVALQRELRNNLPSVANLRNG